jgi:hypothetical protein
VEPFLANGDVVEIKLATNSMSIVGSEKTTTIMMMTIMIMMMMMMIIIIIIIIRGGCGGLEVACCPLVPKFAGSNTAESVGFFGRKNLQHAFLRRGSKAACPMSCFTACKRTQK